MMERRIYLGRLITALLTPGGFQFETQEASISIPFPALPVNMYIKGPRYKVEFDRIVTPKFVKDVDEMQTWSAGLQ